MAVAVAVAIVRRRAAIRCLDGAAPGRLNHLCVFIIAAGHRNGCRRRRRRHHRLLGRLLLARGLPAPRLLRLLLGRLGRRLMLVGQEVVPIDGVGVQELAHHDRRVRIGGAGGGGRGCGGGGR